MIFSDSIAAVLPSKMFNDTRNMIKEMSCETEAKASFWTQRCIELEAAEALLLTTGVLFAGSLTLLALLKEIASSFTEQQPSADANKIIQYVAKFTTMPT